MIKKATLKLTKLYVHKNIYEIKNISYKKNLLASSRQ
jgi:hypothetical protein